MIRATIQNGMIHPLEPLPPDWQDGRELIIEEAETLPTASQLETWVKEIQEAVAEVRPEDRDALERALAEADRVARQQVRKDMELPQ